MWLQEKRIRDIVGAIVESVADEVCKEHIDAITQEPQLTSRIAQAIDSEFVRRLEREFGSSRVGDFYISMVVQEIPDHGRGSLESRIGADLYIGLETVLNGETESKGLLVQAKWDEPLTKSGAKGLRESCRRMLRKTSASYVWLYGRDGVTSLPAAGLKTKRVGKIRGGASIGKLISEALACREGDGRIGLPPARDRSERRRTLGGMLVEWSVSNGISVRVEKWNPDRPLDR
ncbi:MAG TPA: hypothetical protein VG387_04100 [Rhizomicrobium sp.]|jgi:hypothetical protein|nr:hypothetical protein [Rhizomicrobium sp.]